jgi:hypothetical protein
MLTQLLGYRKVCPNSQIRQHKNNHSKMIAFGFVEIIELPITSLGEDTSCGAIGVPISGERGPIRRIKLSIDDYESQKPPQRSRQKLHPRKLARKRLQRMESNQECEMLDLSFDRMRSMAPPDQPLRSPTMARRHDFFGPAPPAQPLIMPARSA